MALPRPISAGMKQKPENAMAHACAHGMCPPKLASLSAQFSASSRKFVYELWAK
jgi:hypothetical protein